MALLHLLEGLYLSFPSRSNLNLNPCLLSRLLLYQEELSSCIFSTSKRGLS